MVPKSALPLWFRKGVTDFVETAVASVLVLTVAGDRYAIANAIFAAVGVAALSAARRNAPAFYLWIREKLDVGAE